MKFKFTQTYNIFRLLIYCNLGLVIVLTAGLNLLFAQHYLDNISQAFPASAEVIDGLAAFGKKVYIFKPSLEINQGENCTTSPNLSLTLQAINAQDVLISEDRFFVNASWQSFYAPTPKDGSTPTSTVNWTLGDQTSGLKTIYVIFRTSTPNMSQTMTDSIYFLRSGKCSDLIAGQEDAYVEKLRASEQIEDNLLQSSSMDSDDSEKAHISIQDAKSQYNLAPGDYIQGKSIPDIYFLIEDGSGGVVRQRLLDSLTFYTYRDNLFDVKKVEDSALSAFNLIGIKGPNPGTIIVKFKSWPETYIVSSEIDGKTVLLHIENEAMATAMLGETWQEHIVEYDDAYFKIFTIKGEVTSTWQIDHIKMKTYLELQILVDKGL